MSTEWISGLALVEPVETISACQILNAETKVSAKRFSNRRDEECLYQSSLFWKRPRSDPNIARPNDPPMIGTPWWNSWIIPQGSWMALDSVLVDVLRRRLTSISSRFCSGMYPPWYLNAPGNCLVDIGEWTIPHVARLSLAWATV